MTRSSNAAHEGLEEKDEHAVHEGEHDPQEHRVDRERAQPSPEAHTLHGLRKRLDEPWS